MDGFNGGYGLCLYRDYEQALLVIEPCYIGGGISILRLNRSNKYYELGKNNFLIGMNVYLNKILSLMSNIDNLSYNDLIVYNLKAELQ